MCEQVYESLRPRADTVCSRQRTAARMPGFSRDRIEQDYVGIGPRCLQPKPVECQIILDSHLCSPTVLRSECVSE